MEHVLMLGNGFDLYYKLPTKYNNFLQLAAFLSDSDALKYKTVGAILKAYTSSQKDAFVAACYYAHQELYDHTTVTSDQIRELRAMTRHNIWFKYLLKSFNKDVGWIDFEKEISNVIHSLHSLLPTLELSNFWFSRPSDQFTNHVIQNLRFFVYCQHSVTQDDEYLLEPEYAIEYPIGSGHYIPDSNKIMSVLATALSELSEALKLYLSIFAESILDVSGAHSHFEWTLPFRGINRIITFNYTKTYERVFYHWVHHLHGSTDGKIVLGINPDKYDEVESADTLCIAFKKYYQRVMYDTDTEYLSWINQDGLEYTLMVMGHSLDVTDADIIMDLFSKAREITIVYHDDNAKSSYIGNIIKMYGKSGFDKLRKEQNLTFRHVNSNFSDIIEKREKNQDDLPAVFTSP